MSVARGFGAAEVDGVRVRVVDAKEERPIIVIDNYDSFTYNLCQVSLSVLLMFLCLFVCWSQRTGIFSESCKPYYLPVDRPINLSY